MCGIFALINPPGKPADLEECRRAVNLVSHRGPDAFGEWRSPVADVYLGHRRLSILDLSDAANQPMMGESGKILIFNGEIYNFRSIRRSLEQKGLRFSTTGDTEVLLKALETWGPDCISDLEGMFAFLLWSPGEGRALAARDFFGIKPLYVWQSRDECIAFASEIKSFLALASFSPELETASLPEYLRFRTVCGDRTLLKGVTLLEPGRYLVHDRARRGLGRGMFWHCSQALGSGEQLPDDLSSPEPFLKRFRPIVERHLIADVPVGVQFSGGIDSSLISAIIAQDLGRKMSGFHCHVQDGAYDETPFAQQLAERFHVTLHTVDLSCETFFSLLEKLTWHNDEPLAHPNAVGIYLISRLAAGRVKVLISGESADEFFGGYQWYRAMVLLESLEKVPLWGTLVKGADRLWPFTSGKVRRLIRLAKISSWSDRACAGTATMDGGLLRELLKDDRAEEKSISNRASLLFDEQGLDWLTRCQLYDIQSYLPPLMIRQDKMSMAASIENRVPFATPEVLSMAMALPSSMRATVWAQKRLLKESLTTYVGEDLVPKRKWGFGIPLVSWLDKTIGKERIDSLTHSGSRLNDHLDAEEIGRLVTNPIRTLPHADALWTLLALHVWMEVFRKQREVRN